MPQWLLSFSTEADEWWARVRSTHHTLVIVALVVAIAVLFAGMLWGYTNLIVIRVTRRVFGSSRLPTPHESALRVAAAEAQAAEAVETIARQIERDVRSMGTQVAAGELPFTIAVNTNIEQQSIEALIRRTQAQNIRVEVSPKGRARRTTKDEPRDDVPTAWARILRDEDEEGTCPTIPEATMEAAPEPAPKKSAKKSASKSKKKRG